jgi:hypothetical protein
MHSPGERGDIGEVQTCGAYDHLITFGRRYDDMIPAFIRKRVFAFEHRHQPLLSRSRFIRRLIAAFALSLFLLGIWLTLGMFGYRYLAGLAWIDAFLNASMIVGGMGPVDQLTSPDAKLFAGFYAILSGVIFLSIFGLLIAPVFHRFLHRFHLDSEEHEPKHRAPKS